MILRGNYDDTYLKVLVDKRFFTIVPLLFGFMGYEVRLHVNHKKGENIECKFNGECEHIYIDNRSHPYRSTVCFRFTDCNRFEQLEDVCQYILDNVDIYKYISKFADDKTICRRLNDALTGNYID